MRWTQSICDKEVSKKIQKANDSISRFSVRLFNSVTIEAGSQREFLRVTYRSSACAGLRTQVSIRSKNCFSFRRKSLEDAKVHQRARFHALIPYWIPLIVILLVLHAPSLRNVVKKCTMGRFCQNWLHSTFCRVIKGWQSSVCTCPALTPINTNCIDFFENDRQEWPVKSLVSHVQKVSKRSWSCKKFTLRFYRKVSILKRNQGKLMFCLVEGWYT